MKKVWKIKDKGYCSDKDLITYIETGKVSPEDYIISDLLKEYVQIKNTVYSFYVKGNQNETI